MNTLQKFLVVIIIAIGLFFGTTYASFKVFATIGKNFATNLITSPDSNSAEVTTKTVACPLNGAAYPETAKIKWDQRRPLGVMIENSTDARPQSGLSSADIVYEAKAEGGITRFMGVFYCTSSDVVVGPVRSARTYFLDWISEYDGLYAHVGGANTAGPANALGQIIDYRIKDLNQFNIGYPTFWRDSQRLGRTVALEHTMYSSTDKLWTVATKKGYGFADASGKDWTGGFTSWKFQDGTATNSSSVPLVVNVNFGQSQNAYSVYWTYDASCNCYKRKNGSSNHIDLDNNQQLSPKNVVIQFENESRANDGYPGNQHLLYQTIGSGKALMLQNGKAMVGKWSKSGRTGRTIYTDSNGQEISFVRGQIWIETVNVSDNVSY